MYLNWTHWYVPELDTLVCTSTGHIGMYLNWTHWYVPKLDTFPGAAELHISGR